MMWLKLIHVNKRDPLTAAYLIGHSRQLLDPWQHSFQIHSGLICDSFMLKSIRLSKKIGSNFQMYASQLFILKLLCF